ncbi:probable UDP-arabinopyranose mutase 5 isoform X2 [Macadamia integrifolia]|uniref:probable UDP-arabinopyranose mutase 5 isoform X2 n=1 Tax=Macadamia integrifolia TaxID=60698 RepID=UPI001C4FAA55|nr:probable UDP-arabinopyranose mutase 5 isoform X2 [Macadamia integrifolia]
MRISPSLLSLAIDSAILNISHLSDLSAIPEHILLDLFLRTLSAGKLTEKVLKLFVTTGNDEILSLIQALNIQHIITPVLPTTIIKDDEVDVVVVAIQPDLTSFLEEWRPILSRYHLIIIKDPEMKEELKIPEGFNHDLYTKSDMDRILGSTSILFSGYSCRYFGYLVSRKKYIVAVDDDCVPAKDDRGFIFDAVAQHISNLRFPATPFFFNTLYDPYQKGADFVRGYPFSLRNGVKCALSCGLWLNLADYDAPTQALKPEERNSRYVDAVLTVPLKGMMPLSGINVAFDREAIGPALIPGLRLAVEGKQRWETIEDIWCGMCAKVVCDHLGLGVKSGVPYVWRKDRGDAVETLKKEWRGMKLMEEVVPFFQSVKLPGTAAVAEDCVLEIAAMVKERLGSVDPLFGQAADAMVEWIRLWKGVASVDRTLGV